jgi:nicotinamide riboside kinase
MAEPLRIAILGAESTGKTTLAQALAVRLAADTGLRVTWVSEWLREWCEREGRTPRPDEQAAIARVQHERIAAAAAAHAVVVCDTTALATAVYSRLLFGDDSLLPMALALHREMALTLLTTTDLPWVADGHQRDGEHVRAPVDAALRELLIAHALPWTPVSGHGDARLEAALDAVAPLLRALDQPGGGLFTRLAARNAEPAAQRWVCPRCDDPECESALHRTTHHEE